MSDVRLTPNLSTRFTQVVDKCTKDPPPSPLSKLTPTDRQRKRVIPWSRRFCDLHPLFAEGWRGVVRNARQGTQVTTSSRQSSSRPSAGEALGLELLQSVREMKAGHAGRITHVKPNEVFEARQGTGLSQAQFAEAPSISKRTLQEWEQGRRSPSGAAQALIRIARKHPEVVREALA